MSERPNLAPADELHAVREQKKMLEERERALRQLLIDDPSARTGNSYVARIVEVEKMQPDIVEMRAMYPDQVAEHTHARKHTEVKLDGITEDGEIVRIPPRKLRTIRVV